MTIIKGKSNSRIARSYDTNTYELPEAFTQRDTEHFQVVRDVSSQEIVQAAQSIVTHQLQEHPILMTNLQLAKTLALLELSDATSEVFCVMFLNNQMRLIYFDRMFKGTVNSTRVYPREIIKRALELNAVWLVLVHNHPSTDCRPSQSDEQLTQQLNSILSILDIGIIDHLIVGGGEVFSFAENGKL